jgi:hypothetical protein
MNQKQHLPPDIEQFLREREGKKRPDQEPQSDTDQFPPAEQVQENPVETIRVYIEQDRVTFVKEIPPLVESEPPAPRKSRLPFPVLIGCGVCLLVIVSGLASTLLLLFPQTATITITPVARSLTATVTLAASMKPIGNEVATRLLPTFTLSQVKVVEATGRGHQVATQAGGPITMFNGLFTSRTIAAGTILTGKDGVQVVTNTAALIPPAQATTPPTYGRVTVEARALDAGPQGNIPAYDLNAPCCATSVLAQNTGAFQGGQNAYDYRYITRRDITQAATPMRATLASSIQAALVAQLLPGEALVAPMCVPTTTSSNQPGDRESQVRVTASESCTALAYNQQAAQEQAGNLFTTQALHTFGPSYSLGSAMHITAAYAVLPNATKSIISLAITMSGRWVYRLSRQKQAYLKQLVKGEKVAQALRTLENQPGIERVTISSQELLPTNPDNIHLLMVEGGEQTTPGVLPDSLVARHAFEQAVPVYAPSSDYNDGAIISRLESGS